MDPAAPFAKPSFFETEGRVWIEKEEGGPVGFQARLHVAMATALRRKRRRPSFQISTRIFVQRDINRKRSKELQRCGDARFKNRQKR